MIPASISHKVLYAARILPTLANNVHTSSHNLNKQLQLETIVVVGTGRIASANFCLQPKHKHQVGLEKMNKPNLVRWSNFRLRTRPRSSFGNRRDGSESAQCRFPVKSFRCGIVFQQRTHLPVVSTNAVWPGQVQHFNWRQITVRSWSKILASSRRASATL